MDADGVRGEEGPSERGREADPARTRLRQEGRRRLRAVVGSRREVRGERKACRVTESGGFGTQERAGPTEGAKAVRA